MPRAVTNGQRGFENDDTPAGDDDPTDKRIEKENRERDERRRADWERCVAIEATLQKEREDREAAETAELVRRDREAKLRALP